MAGNCSPGRKAEREDHTWAGRALQKGPRVYHLLLQVLSQQRMGGGRRNLILFVAEAIPAPAPDLELISVLIGR